MKRTCHDCLCEEGGLHEEGCDMERCPVCKRQLLSCPKHSWEDFKDIEREPFFYKGFSCARCGKFIPKMLMVKKKQWEYICGSSYEDEDVLCIKCMEFIILNRGKNG